jgi:ligand-binding SRPBCC domain-containing protein
MWMPIFEASLILTREPAVVFAWFIQPALVLGATPPELSLRLEEAPGILFPGARTVIVGRRWGLSHRSVLEVTAFEPDRLLVEEQREGPFRRWRVSHTFEPVDGDTRLTGLVEFQPPGGILGLKVTEAFVRRELESLFAYRAARLRELFGAPSG